MRLIKTLNGEISGSNPRLAVIRSLSSFGEGGGGGVCGGWGGVCVCGGGGTEVVEPVIHFVGRFGLAVRR